MDVFRVITNVVCKNCNQIIKRTVRIAVVGYAETIDAHCTVCGRDCMNEFYPSEK